jgi:hypothetical protein
VPFHIKTQAAIWDGLLERVKACPSDAQASFGVFGVTVGTRERVPFRIIFVVIVLS